MSNVSLGPYYLTIMLSCNTINLKISFKLICFFRLVLLNKSKSLSKNLSKPGNIFNLKSKRANFKHIKLPNKQNFEMVVITKISLRSLFKGITINQQANKNDKLKTITPILIPMDKNNKSIHFNSKRDCKTKEKKIKMNIQL